jgi:hypothetical protein
MICSCIIISLLFVFDSVAQIVVLENIVGQINASTQRIVRTAIVRYRYLSSGDEYFRSFTSTVRGPGPEFDNWIVCLRSLLYHI